MKRYPVSLQMLAVKVALANEATQAEAQREAEAKASK